MAQKFKNESAAPGTAKHGGFKPVAIPAVIAAVQMQKSAPAAMRSYELPAILRKEALVG